MRIEREQRALNNFMWEIQYPFPYEDNVFLDNTVKLHSISAESALEKYTEYHKLMKDHLNETDFEYMVWQEWKEGYARYVENLIRMELSISKNTTALNPPFDRVCFYGLGSCYIEALLKADPALNEDLERLFERISLK